MSRILTLQDVDPFDVALTVSEAYGWSALPCHLPGIETVNGQIHTYSGKRPLVRYKQYREHRASPAQLREWQEQFTTDKGPPNWVFITGHSASSLALYVTDTDTAELSPWLQSTGTTTIQSGRLGGGWHNWYVGTAGLYRTRPALELPDGSYVRFQGVEGIIVLPGSLHASGNVYNCVSGYDMDAIKNVSEIGWLAMSLQSDNNAELTREANKARYRVHTRGRACIEQILYSGRGKGWRHSMLYVLTQELWNAYNRSDVIQRTLLQFNRGFDVRLDESEVIESYVRPGWTKTQPGNKYGALGCVTARSHYLPWLDCSRCPHRRDMLTLGYDTALEHGLGPNEQSVLMFATLGRYKSDKATAETCHMDRGTVKKTREHLQALGLWPVMPERSTEGSCGNTRTSNEQENDPLDLILTDRTSSDKKSS